METETTTYANWLSLVLSNFDLVMFLVAIFFMFINRMLTGNRVRPAEIIFRWTILFAVGFTGLYAAVMHIFFQDIAAPAIGWTPSPFEYEVGIADLAFGVLGILAFNASYPFRLATVIGVTVWFWGVAIGHIYQIMQMQNYSIGNAGSWLWMDLLIPLLLLVCLTKVKPVKKLF